MTSGTVSISIETLRAIREVLEDLDGISDEMSLMEIRRSERAYLLLLELPNGETDTEENNK